MVDLATARYGGAVVWCSDEFFAAASNLVSPVPPIWQEGVFTDHGKWMDGWETRRRRDEGFDSCVVRLGLPGIVNSVVVDTSYFTGNYPESFSVDACGVAPEQLEQAEWVELLPRTPLSGDTVASFEVDDDHRVTHLRLNIYPDGGVARIRAEGDPIPEMDLVCPEGRDVDLAVATVGGRGQEASDAHYSSPENLVSPTEPEGMWDGWETARRRGPGNDWAVISLGLPGAIRAVDVDTRHFKGNAPGWVSLDVACGDGEWKEACDRVAVDPDTVNRVELPGPMEADRVRLNVFPDGGVARLRVWGQPEQEAASGIRMRYLNALLTQEARRFFQTACASGAWVAEMASHGPYSTPVAVLEAAEHAFERLTEDDWLEAFSAHPRIGERHGAQTAEGEAMSASEQTGVESRDHDLTRAMADANRSYEERFGYTYIVRAAGRTGEEMLALARSRLENEAGEELSVAAGQQREITRGRLRRMLCLDEEER